MGKKSGSGINILDPQHCLKTLSTCVWQAGEEEKDPRNLLLLFSITARVLDSLTVHHLTEDIFESLAVYFPIGERFNSVVDSYPDPVLY
jgi:hypothetical protein